MEWCWVQWNGENQGQLKETNKTNLTTCICNKGNKANYLKQENKPYYLKQRIQTLISVTIKG